jgi:hypothetical protein
MPWQVMVELRGSNTLVYSPEYGSREEAEQELAKVRTAISSQRVADVTWMAASGRDILGAQVIDSSPRESRRGARCRASSG